MKRLLSLALVACLLLCGCQTEGEPAQTTQPGTTAGTDPAVMTTDPAPEATDPTVEATEPVPTEPVLPETVTVYLLEGTMLYDSGRTAYEYDEDYNIDLSQTYTVEDELMYTTYYENKDENGMAGCVRNAWISGDSDSMLLKHFADGKLEEELYEGSNYSGYQYAYDQKGDLVEKREYWDGILTSTVRYEYEGEELVRLYCEDVEGNHIYDCRVEDGRVIEKVCYSDAGSYSYGYEYDENGNRIKETFTYEGETTPSVTYTYKAVEVDASRACYLLEQQKYLLENS